MIKFATIGSGWIVESFLEGGRELDSFKLQKVYSRNLEKAKEIAKSWKAESFCDNLADIANDQQVDAVYIASPNAVHYEQTKQMLMAGKHVICEKPFVYTPQQTEELITLSKSKNLVLLEASRAAYMPGTYKIKELIQSIGKVRGATLCYNQYSSRYDKFKNGIIENAFNPSLGNGALMDIGVYCIIALVDFFGMPKEIIGRGTFLKNSIDACGSSIATYDDFSCIISYSKVADSFQESEIIGEDGSLIFNISKPKKIQLVKRDGTKTTFDYNDKPDMYYEIEEFIKNINGESDNAKWLDLTLNTTKLMEDLRKQIGIDFKI